MQVPNYLKSGIHKQPLKFVVENGLLISAFLEIFFDASIKIVSKYLLGSVSF